MKKPSNRSWDSILLANLFIFFLCGAFGANLVGQFTSDQTTFKIVFFFSGLVFMTDRKWLWRIDLLLIRRIILFVGVVTMISGAIVWNNQAESYFEAGLQTLPTHIISFAALIATLYIHYVKKTLDIKPRAYVLQNGEYQKVVGPAELLSNITGIGGYIVIGDEKEICSGVYFSSFNEVDEQSIGGYEISEMELGPLDDKDKKNLGL